MGLKKIVLVSSIAKLKSDYKNPKSFLDLLVRLERHGSGVGRKKDRDFPDRVSREKNGKRWEQTCCVSAGKKSADPDLSVYNFPSVFCIIR